MASRRGRPVSKVAQGNFLEALGSGCTVGEAAAVAGVERSTPYRWRTADPEFAALWREAYAIGADALEAEAQRRAMKGTTRPVFHQGEVCGGIQDYSDTLLMFLMKGRDPNRYCDKARAAKIAAEYAAKLASADVNTAIRDEVFELLDRLADEKAATAKSVTNVH